MDQENIDINKQTEVAMDDDYDLKAEFGSKRRKLRRLAPLEDEEGYDGGVSSSKVTDPANITQDQTNKSVIIINLII